MRTVAKAVCVAGEGNQTFALVVLRFPLWAERWLSGRKRRFAKPLYGLHRTGGSNPPLSAIHTCSVFGLLSQLANAQKFARETSPIVQTHQKRGLARQIAMGCVSNSIYRCRRHGAESAPAWLANSIACMLVRVSCRVACQSAATPVACALFEKLTWTTRTR